MLILSFGFPKMQAEHYIYTKMKVLAVNQQVSEFLGDGVRDVELFAEEAESFGALLELIGCQRKSRWGIRREFGRGGGGRGGSSGHG